MNVFVKNTKAGNVILISADERLDLFAYEAFGEAANLAINNPRPSAIVVDLGKTQQLFDSGKAMLLTLHQRAGRLKDRIYLTNVGAEIKHKLTQGRFSNLFHIGYKKHIATHK
jgi:anti-anti-sigma regulatory factor